MDSHGNLWGVGDFGGANSQGAIFEIPAGTTSLSSVASFSSSTTGFDPFAAMTIDGSGDLFGTTLFGAGGSKGGVFELPVGSSTITNLASFSAATGYNPSGSLMFVPAEISTAPRNPGAPNNDGTVFELLKNAQRHYFRGIIQRIHGPEQHGHPGHG